LEVLAYRLKTSVANKPPSDIGSVVGTTYKLSESLRQMVLEIRLVVVSDEPELCHRRILVRWEKKPENYLGLLQLACALLWFRYYLTLAPWLRS
jgi:hypothetical protein